MGIAEKIAEIEREIARTQKNKATEHHIGLLKARLAKLRCQLIESSNEAAGKGQGFDVARVGNARVALIGFPSVGKSTLLSTLTHSKSEVAAYEFTTLTCIPGIIEYKETKIQLLDLPGIIEGASQGIGRGRQVIAVARTADLIVIMLDATEGSKQLPLLVKELDACGIRINKTKPDVYYKQKNAGGIKISRTVPLTHIDENFIMRTLSMYRIHNAELIFRHDCTEDEFIDVLLGNRVYIPALYVYNKIDRISIEDIDKIARKPHSVVISCNYNLNFDYLLEKIWEYLSLIRIYTKRPGEFPDFSDPLIMKSSASVKDACTMLHKSIVAQFKFALVWGKSAKYNPQRVGLAHLLADEDVIQIAKT